MSCPWSFETELPRPPSASRPCTNLLLLLCMPTCLPLPASTSACLPACPAKHRIRLALCAEPLRLHASPPTPTACHPPSPLFVRLGHAVQWLIPTYRLVHTTESTFQHCHPPTTHLNPTLLPQQRKLHAQPRGTPSLALSHPAPHSPAVCEARPTSTSSARRMRRRTLRSKDICHCNVP